MFIVKAHGGNYEGSYDWPIAVFQDQEAALLFVEFLKIGTFSELIPGTDLDAFAIVKVLEDGSLGDNYVAEYFMDDYQRNHRRKWESDIGKDYQENV